MKINEIIQSKRKALKMTQLQLAEKLDVSDKTVSRWELGSIYPNIDMIPKIAAVLELNINELFGDSGNINTTINTSEERNYKKITILKIYLFVLVSCSIISLVLYFCGIQASETSSKTSALLIISAVLLFLLASTAFFINRFLFSAFYKEKFYFSEYRYFDSKITTIAIFLNSFMIGFFTLSSKMIFFQLLVFTFATLITFYFLKDLEYSFKKRCLIPLGISSILYLGLLLFSIISLISHLNILIIPFIIFIFVINSIACLTLLLFKSKK